MRFLNKVQDLKIEIHSEINLGLELAVLSPNGLIVDRPIWKNLLKFGVGVGGGGWEDAFQN